MDKPTALIINDTSNAYHWGCFGTSTELRLSLEDLGYFVTTFGVAKVHTLKTPPKTENHISDAGFRRVFLADNPGLRKVLDSADVVVVNGEGTLHGLSQAALNLLYVSNLAKSEFGKTVHAINMSLFPNGWSPVDEKSARLYHDMLSPLDRITLREPLSYKAAGEIGLSTHLGLDCLPRYLKREGYLNKSRQNGGAIILGGGLGLDLPNFRSFLTQASQRLKDRELVYITGAPGNVATDDAKVVKSLQDENPNVRHLELTSFEDWAMTMKNADCLISGRFHHTIAAAFMGTPTVTFRAATPKIDGLCESLDFPYPIDSATDGAIGEALEKLDDALDRGSPKLADDKLGRLLALSALNFDELDPV